MKKIGVIAAFLLLGSLSLRAQQTGSGVSGHQFYVEMGGPGVLFSANFDGRFEAGQRLGFGYRLGVGFAYGDVVVGDDYGEGYYGEDYSEFRSYLTIPVGINYVFGKPGSSHTFEVGASLVCFPKKVYVYNWYDSSAAGHFAGTFSFMYRLSPVNGGFTWRIGFTPSVGTSGDIVPLMAVGMGYAF